MDETPLYNDQRPKKTIADKGSKCVSGKKTRTGDYRSTVFLAVTRTGEKLPPMVVFKGKPGKTVEKKFTVANGFPANVVCVCQENAWCDEGIMLKWVERVYQPFVSEKEGFAHLLVDDYTAHGMHSVNKAVKKGGSFYSIIPGGATSMIQVLDVGVNKPFKDKFRTRWVQWMALENQQNDKVISRVLLANWVSQVWNEIDSKAIMNTWAKCNYEQYND